MATSGAGCCAHPEPAITRPASAPVVPLPSIPDATDATAAAAAVSVRSGGSWCDSCIHLTMMMVETMVTKRMKTTTFVPMSGVPDVSLCCIFFNCNFVSRVKGMDQWVTDQNTRILLTTVMGGEAGVRNREPPARLQYMRRQLPDEESSDKILTFDGRRPNVTSLGSQESSEESSVKWPSECELVIVESMDELMLFILMTGPCVADPIPAIRNSNLTTG